MAKTDLRSVTKILESEWIFSQCDQLSNPNHRGHWPMITMHCGLSLSHVKFSTFESQWGRCCKCWIYMKSGTWAHSPFISTHPEFRKNMIIIFAKTSLWKRPCFRRYFETLGRWGQVIKISENPNILHEGVSGQASKLVRVPNWISKILVFHYGLMDM